MNQWGGSAGAWDQGWDQPEAWDNQWDHEGAYLRSFGCIDAVEKKSDSFYENTFTAESSALREQWLGDGATVAPCTQCRPPIVIANRYTAI